VTYIYSVYVSLLSGLFYAKAILISILLPVPTLMARPFTIPCLLVSMMTQPLSSRIEGTKKI
jgi:hypothetical protein